MLGFYMYIYTKVFLVQMLMLKIRYKKFLLIKTFKSQQESLSTSNYFLLHLSKKQHRIFILFAIIFN
jgi:hypothetical protein